MHQQTHAQAVASLDAELRAAGIEAPATLRRIGECTHRQDIQAITRLVHLAWHNGFAEGELRAQLKATYGPPNTPMPGAPF